MSLGQHTACGSLEGGGWDVSSSFPSSRPREEAAFLLHAIPREGGGSGWVFSGERMVRRGTGSQRKWWWH